MSVKVVNVHVHVHACTCICIGVSVNFINCVKVCVHVCIRVCVPIMPVSVFVFMFIGEFFALLFSANNLKQLFSALPTGNCLSLGNLYGGIGSGYPTNVYDSNRLLLPIQY